MSLYACLVCALLNEPSLHLPHIYIYAIKALYFLLLPLTTYFALYIISNPWMVSNNKQTFEGNESGERRGNRIPVMQSTQRHNDPKQTPLRYLLFVLTLVMVPLDANSNFFCCVVALEM